VAVARKLLGMLCAVRRRVGHRGACLLFFAFLDLIYGTILICDDPSPRTALAYLANHWPPLDVWGVIWIGIGISCLAHAFVAQDSLGFVGAMALKFAWGAAHFWAFVDGAPRALAGTVIWIMATGLVFIISTWPEPPQLKVDAESGG
jgi:hypothetical protein